MQFDLLTLYFLAVGTLLLSAVLTLWECKTRPRRTREMCILAGGYCALAVGCALAIFRSELPAAIGPSLSNMTILSGYLLILEAVAILGGRSQRRAAIAILMVSALGWVIAGQRWPNGSWNYLSAAPIALVSAATAWQMVRARQLRALPSRHMVVALTVGHALSYAARAFILPVFTEPLGSEVISLASRVTMYEGVLYSVALPMALLALFREEAHANLLQASHTDYLTGLSNRRSFFERGEAIVSAASRSEITVSLLAFDLDHFKAINDRHGHAIGDLVLRSFAQVVRNVVGPTTVVARLGGEEFAAILPGCDKWQAQAVGKLVSSRFAAVTVQDALGCPVSATVSIGLAEYGCDGIALNDLLTAADRGLYLAKAQGRNRIEFAPLPISVAA